MRSARCLLAMAMVCATAVQAAPARLRGYAEINRILRQRLFVPESRFQLGHYLDEEYVDPGSNLLDLLGTYKGNDLESRFKNGSPNSANMLLWHFLMASLARDVASECGRSTGLDLNKDFKAAVLNACRWPAAASRTSEALERLWTLVVEYDAPRSEFENWRTFIQGATFTSPDEAVFSMLLTMTSNPRFLLEG